MKKLFIGLLLGALTLSCACNKPLDEQVDISTSENIEVNDEEITSETVEDSDTSTSQKAGEELGNYFLEIVNGNPEDTIDDIIIKFINETPTPFELSSVLVEEGYLSGFNNVEITGFKTAYQIAPMIGSIPFIAYAFEVDEANVEEFKTTLMDNADLRWNICTEADSKVCVNKDGLVFFVMSPDTFEE